MDGVAGGIHVVGRLHKVILESDTKLLRPSCAMMVVVM